MNTKKTTGKKGEKVFTAEERAAIQQRAKEVKAGEEDGERVVLEKIGQMEPSDRAVAKRVHEVVMKSVPTLTPRLWYGMPAYSNKDGKTVCFFQDARKFKTRYSTFGFNDSAKLDDGEMWPVAFALTKLTPAAESRIAALVKKAVG